MNIIIDKNSCVLCNMCVFSCPMGLLRRDIDKIQINATELDCGGDCKECINSCPVGAIEYSDDDLSGGY